MSVAVLEQGQRTLQELADEANREHEAACAATAQALHHWIRAGDALKEVRDRLQWGEFGPWVDVNFEGQRGLASACIRLSVYQDEIRDEGITTINRARLFLRGLSAKSPQQANKSEEVKTLTEEARRLRDRGMSYYEVGLVLGCNSGTIWNWLNPEQYRLNQLRQQEKRQQAKRDKEAKEQRRLDRAVRKVGGAVAESYSLLRKTAEALGRAETEASNQEVRAAVRGALAQVYKAEDEIIKALGIS